MTTLLTTMQAHGRSTGDFLHGVLSNDLMRTFAHADEQNRRVVHRYAQFLYNHAPVGCYGSEAQVNRWMQIGGLYGVEKAGLPPSAGEV